ncbi:MAG TPA: hypothetical protein VG722_04530 [Tepidisphaeraceae bacterium]|nr:hypothetical protein [Tepidisphaeraceae bacterium]
MSKSVSLGVVSTPQSKNECGECTACCDVLAIRELGKPFYSRCQHVLLGKGCGIYAERPAPCSAFRCAWLAGVLGESIDRRPDKCGLMFDLSPEERPPRLAVWETIPGALKKENLQYLIKKVREHKLVRGVKFGRPAVVLYPYGAKSGLQFDVAEEYDDWKPPISKALQLRPVGPAHPDEAWFAGEIEPLHLPSKPLSANTGSTNQTQKPEG